MKYIINKSAILIFLFFSSNLSAVYSCSCFETSFCDILSDGTDQVVFKGKVLDITYPSDRYKSVTIEVIKLFSNQISVTDTIELIGGKNESSCENYLSEFNVGETRYVALNYTSGNIINLSTVATANPNFWRHSPNLCSINILDTKEDKVEGYINNEFTSYPIGLFEEKLFNCDFSFEDIEDCFCPNISLYPNPVTSGALYISDRSTLSVIKSIRIFTPNGKLILDLSRDEISSTIELPIIHEKLILVEITCGKERIIEKIYKNAH